MTVRSWISVVVGAVMLSACAKTPDVHDTITAAAQDLRWNKLASTVVIVKVPFPKPFVVLAVGPGTYTLEQRQALVSSAEARELLAKHRYTVEPDVPALYIFAGKGSESAFLRDQFLVPRPLAIWKRDDTPLEVFLERSGDDVRITGLR